MMYCVWNVDISNSDRICVATNGDVQRNFVNGESTTESSATDVARNEVTGFDRR